MEELTDVAFTLVIEYFVALQLFFVAKHLFHLSHSGVVQETEETPIKDRKDLQSESDLKQNSIGTNNSKEEIARENSKIVKPSEVSGCDPKENKVNNNYHIGSVKIEKEKHKGKANALPNAKISESDFFNKENNCRKIESKVKIIEETENSSEKENLMKRAEEMKKVEIEDSSTSINIDDQKIFVAPTKSKNTVTDEIQTDTITCDEHLSKRSQNQLDKANIQTNFKKATERDNLVLNEKEELIKEQTEVAVPSGELLDIETCLPPSVSQDEEENAIVSVNELNEAPPRSKRATYTVEVTEKEEKVEENSKFEAEHAQAKGTSNENEIVLTEEEKERIINLNEDDVQFKNISDVLKSIQFDENVVETPLNEDTPTADQIEYLENDPNTNSPLRRSARMNEIDHYEERWKHDESEEQKQMEQIERLIEIGKQVISPSSSADTTSSNNKLSLDVSRKVKDSKRSPTPTIELFDETGRKTPTVNFNDGLSLPTTPAFDIMDGLSDFYDFNASINPSRSRSVSRSNSVQPTPSSSRPTTPDSSKIGNHSVAPSFRENHS